MTNRKPKNTNLARSISSFQAREGGVMEDDYPELPEFLRRVPLNGHVQELTPDPSDDTPSAELTLGAALAPDVPVVKPRFWSEVAVAFIGTIVILVIGFAAAVVYHLVYHSGAVH